MNTLRQELEQMGVDRVRAAMVAFEHRAEGAVYWASKCPEHGMCCFVSHAYGGPKAYNEARSNNAPPAVECAFEGLTHQPNYCGDRAALHAECVVFLAEHGTAVEPATSGVGGPNT